MIDNIVYLLECLGAVSFSISGALAAVSRKADIMGVLFLSLTTVFGGGVIRDIVLGVTPPHLLWDRKYWFMALLSLIVSVACFVFAFVSRSKKALEKQTHSFALNLTDAIGLSIFCIGGIHTAVSYGYSDNNVLLIFCGVITGTGGGILRDVLSGRIPLVFTKHVYLLPALLGSILYVFIRGLIPELAAMLIAVLFIITIRVLAIIFRWNLPTPHLNADTDSN